MDKIKFSFVVCIILSFLLTASSAFASTIKLNEFYSAGTGNDNPDWVEIYYSNIDISLYQLKDATTTGNTKNLSDATCGGNFCTIDWSDKLNLNEDTIKLVLISAPDSPIDQVTYGSSGDVSVPSTGQSAGRNSDETGSWVLFSTPSKGSSNNSSPTVAPTPTLTPVPNTPTSIPPTETPVPPTPTETPIPPTPVPATKTPTPIKTPTPAKSTSKTPVPTTPFTPTPDSAKLPSSILGVSQDATSPTPEPKNEAEVSPLKNILTIGGGLIFVLAGVFVATFVIRKRPEQL